MAAWLHGGKYDIHNTIGLLKHPTEELRSYLLENYNTFTKLMSMCFVYIYIM
jgi:hypothetical protein